ncbi:S1/P1 nuclease [Kordiimonas lipolytica]|uniref:S1/P1 nuclease n=1 Tax=Kordiimonas lipolytica TaxID=1662421 RepID=A0ABV8U9T2_9PROT|nr:S1/P1 nuclease [Kordiimonas lipolytica]
MVRVLVALFALVVMMGQAAQAYGPTGHRVIAELASRHLSPEAAAAVKELLGDEFMAEAANWPDEMRSNPDEFWRRTASPFHYINLPDGETYEESVKNPAGDAVTALAAFTATVKDKDAPLAERQKALRFIIHIVGDLHQPLHAGRAEDWGGNRIDVVWFEEMSNLHKVWDEDLINYKLLSFSEWVRFLEPKIKPDDIATWQDSEPLDWVRELIAMRGEVYNVGSGILSYDYVYKYTPVIKQQLSKGGIRLAGYLNQMFASE